MRRRILALVMGMTTLVVLAFAIPSGVLIRSAVLQRAEQATIDQADSVAVFLRSGAPSRAVIERYAHSLSAATGRPTSVLLPDGVKVGDPSAEASDRARRSWEGREPLQGRQPLQGRESPGGSGSSDGGREGGRGGGRSPDLSPNPRAVLSAGSGGQVAEVAVATGQGSYLVSVFASDEVLHAGQGRWFLLLISGSLALLLIGGLAGELLTRRITRPLTSSAETARLLSEGDTTARAPVDGPREIAAVGTALNALADRTDELIAEARETAADLSHRLRTPLTALRLDAEALTEPVEAERIGAHVSELERTLTAVIRAARRPQREGRVPRCDATEIVGDRVRFWSALAEDQRRPVALDLPTEPVLVRAAGEDLAAAVDALLENIIAHTPEGTAFSVSLAAGPDGALLQVADEGPGLTHPMPSRGRSDRGSSGLGLDIARRCAEASGGLMRIGRSEPGGVLVALALKA
ncbi:MAG TPA: HAMP domain-containing sensor histidine kinase [Jatrophihabitans sp.]|jgi:signal transduction histidine kinase|uniref:HAMP domain-containing sensor histidine kinase n=1 Tax=Jatrophihabitans sp. TaxID=1932789 RepID=UPI002EF785BE